MSGFANRGPQDNLPGTTYGPGPGLFDPTVAAQGGGRSYASVTANAGGGRAKATRLQAAVVRVSVCATAADSVALPPAVGGQVIHMINNGSAACQVFADVATSDTINGAAAATGVSLPVGKGIAFCSAAPGIWFGILSA